MVTMIIWSLVYRGFKFWSGQIKRCNGYHAHLEFSISWIQTLVGGSNQRCNGYHAHLEFSISWVQALVRGSNQRACNG